MRILSALLLIGSVLASTRNVFTAEDMLSAPRPQAPVVGPDGAHAISVVDQWDPKTDSTSRSVYLLALNTSVSVHPIPLFETTPGAASNVIWLSSTTVAYLNDSSLYAFDVNYKTLANNEKSIEKTLVLEFPEGVLPSSLTYEAKAGILGFSAAVWEDGDFESVARGNARYEKRNKGSSGQVYDDLYVRYWDTWRTPGKVFTLGLVKLDRKENKAGGEEFSLGELKGQRFVNVLNGTGLVSQTDPIDTSHYSLSSTHVAVAVKPPHLNVALHTRLNVYLLPLPHLTSSVAPPLQLTGGGQGAVSGVNFSPDEKKIAWLEMGIDGYESDRNVVVVHELSTTRGKAGLNVEWTSEWDRSPSSISWSLDSRSLYLIAEHHGRALPYHLSHASHLPTPLHFNGSTSSLHPLSPTAVLLTISSLTSPADSFVLDTTVPPRNLHPGDGDHYPHQPLFRLTDWSGKHIDGRLQDLGGEKFWFEGAEEKKVMGWALRPRGWKKGEKKVWPMAFLIHGGPQGAWDDAWSTRWNPALFASQGYFVIAVNPTGSTGYGQEFTDRIRTEWGGRPFKDLLAGYQYALEKYPEIDPARTVAAGGSYGGYMVNWINGHNDQFGFKALVCHDGVFSTVDTFFSTEDVFFPIREFDGTPMENRAMYERWNPVNHVSEWTTPQLVIHSAKDYRLTNSEGVSAFNALQVQGVPSRYLYFPDENHWVGSP
ncbi:hypothetical protein P7C73_g3487, partial [Tremellales sp. Uapishka_1]